MILVISTDMVDSLVSGCVEVHDLVVLCPTTNIGMLSVGETYLVNRPMMLVWGHSICMKWLACKSVQGLSLWYSNWTCCVSEVHNLLVMCPAQHGHLHVVTVAKLSCQWSSNWGYYPGNLYLALLLNPCDELGKASLCQTEGFFL
jgi:hypothetical protein